MFPNVNCCVIVSFFFVDLLLVYHTNFLLYSHADRCLRGLNTLPLAKFAIKSQLFYLQNVVLLGVDLVKQQFTAGLTYDSCMLCANYFFS
jgi:hypothetical protein